MRINLEKWRDIQSSKTLCTDQVDSIFPLKMVGLRFVPFFNILENSQKLDHYLTSRNTSIIGRSRILYINFTHRLIKNMMSLFCIYVTIGGQTYDYRRNQNSYSTY